MTSSLPTIFDLCQPRADVLAGRVADADFAADLASVIAGNASAEYADPARFFANTYPTGGLRGLLANVCARLSGSGEEAATIFRLDTTYGGGKTHGLIALLHAAGGMKGVANASEFVDPTLLPTGAVRIAAFDGENADPANGRDVGDGVLAYTPWGEIAHALAGAAGYERVRRSDEQGIAPGAETLRELFGGEPTLILLDELAVYLRKVWRQQGAAQQLTAFLTSLFKAVEGAPNAALVYTLAVGSDGRATDAYSEENQFVADAMAEMMSVSARKATLLNPTQDAETAPVLLRRLFERVDDGKAGVIDAYQALWREHRESLAEEAARPQTAQDFATSYPFHPDVLATLRGKTSTLSEFQRVRGMLRLLARTIAHLWQERPADATAIHLHHVDLGQEPIRQELVTRLGQSAFVPAIANDIASGSGGAGGESGESQSLAESIDAAHYRGLPPYAAYAARTTFLHTLAFNEPLKGLAPEHLRYAMLAPTLDISFVEEARKRFVAESAYLDDRPGAPMRFLAEANLNQIIRREERNVDAGEARAELGDRIGHIFNGETFDAIRFPGGPFDVPDEVGDGRPKLIVLSYDAVSFGAQASELPSLVERIYTRKGADGASLRALRNHLVFVATDDAGKAEMQRHARLRLALRALKRADRLRDLGEHQQDQVLEKEARSEQELAIAIQQAYRHVLYPSSAGMDAEVSLAHTAHRHPLRRRPARRRPAPHRPGAARTAEAPPARGRSGRAGVRARPHAVAQGADDYAGAARRVPPRPQTAHVDRRRHVHPRHPHRRGTRRLRLSARRSAVRAGRPAGIRADRRAGGGADHGLRQEHRRMAAATSGGTSKTRRSRNRHRGLRSARGGRNTMPTPKRKRPSSAPKARCARRWFACGSRPATRTSSASVN